MEQGIAELMDHLCDCTEYFASKMVEAGFQMPNPPFSTNFLSSAIQKNIRRQCWRKFRRQERSGAEARFGKVKL